MAGGLELGDL